MQTAPARTLRIRRLAAPIVAACAIATAGPTFSITRTDLPDRPDADIAFGLDIVAVSADEVWATGEWRDELPSGGTDLGTQIFRFDGAVWTRIDPPHTASTCNDRIWFVARAIDAAGSEQLFAAGEYKKDSCSSSDTLLLEGEGEDWSQTITPGQSAFGASGYFFEDVHVTGDGVVWMGGQFTHSGDAGRPSATVIRMEGGDFERFDGPLILNAAHRIRAIDSSAPDDIWAVGSLGGFAAAVGRSYALHHDGSGWSEVSPPQVGIGEIIAAVEAIAPDDVWLSGRYQVIAPDGLSLITLPLMWHWDGTDWTRHDSPGFAADLVHFASDDVYGVSGDTLVHWDGAAWSVAATLDPDEFELPALRGLAVTGPGEMIAIGDDGPGVTAGRRSMAVRFSADGPSCPADLAAPQGVINFFDLAAFLALYNAGDDAADLAMPNGVLNFFDLSAYLDLYNAGCP